MNKTFSSPIDASNYLADFGMATGILLRSIDYTTGEVHFSLVGSGGAASAINGLIVADVSEDTVAEAVRAAIAATN